MRRRFLFPAAALATAAGLLSGCHDARFIGGARKDTGRIGVEGRVVTASAGIAVAGTKLTLIATIASVAESTQTVSDADGLFSLVLPVGAVTPPTLDLRVLPPGKPGYTI